jgi:hypothetical protein
MQNLSSKADHYREQAVKCHELAKSASPPYFGDFYRRVAVRYLFMAEDASRRAETRATLSRIGEDSVSADGAHCARSERV